MIKLMCRFLESARKKSRKEYFQLLFDFTNVYAKEINFNCYIIIFYSMVTLYDDLHIKILCLFLPRLFSVLSNFFGFTCVYETLCAVSEFQDNPVFSGIEESFELLSLFDG